MWQTRLAQLGVHRATAASPRLTHALTPRSAINAYGYCKGANLGKKMEWCRYGYHIDGTLVTQTCLGKGTSRMQQVRFVEPSKVKTAFPHIRF